MTRQCRICPLNPVITSWVEALLKQGYSCRTMQAILADRGIEVSYRSIHRHKGHMELKEKIQRLMLEITRQSGRRRPPLSSSITFLRERIDQLERWIQAEGSRAPERAIKRLVELRELLSKYEEVALMFERHGMSFERKRVRFL